MQSACYIMHGLSLSQRSFTPCCASPPTAPRRQADTHIYTHPTSCVSSHILYSSTLTLSPTLSVCSQTATQMSERERQRGRLRVGGVGRLKVKYKERENYRLKCAFMPRLRICMIARIYVHAILVSVIFSTACQYKIIFEGHLWGQQFSKHLNFCNHWQVFIFLTAFFTVSSESQETLTTSPQTDGGIISHCHSQVTPTVWASTYMSLPVFHVIHLQNRKWVTSSLLFFLQKYF